MSLLNHTTLVLDSEYSNLNDFFMSLPECFAQNEGKLIHNGRNQLRTIMYEGNNYVVKSFRKPNFINQFVYGIFRPSKAKRSFDHAELLLNIGVGTPKPIGYMNIRKGILFDKSYYVSLESKCSHIYQEIFEHKFEYEEEILREVGRVTAKLHEHGYAHKDYGRANILFEKRDNGVDIELVDLNRLAIGPLDIKAGCKNLERLPATPQMHRWIAEEYAKARGFDAEECYRLMSSYRACQPGKIDNLY